eukprot:365812-Chlamydomonas_euryale.AAC.10
MRGQQRDRPHGSCSLWHCKPTACHSMRSPRLRCPVTCAAAPHRTSKSAYGVGIRTAERLLGMSCQNNTSLEPNALLLHASTPPHLNPMSCLTCSTSWRTPVPLVDDTRKMRSGRGRPACFKRSHTQVCTTAVRGKGRGRGLLYMVPGGRHHIWGEGG